MSKTPEHILAKIQRAKERQLRELGLNGSSLAQIRKEVHELENLEVLIRLLRELKVIVNVNVYASSTQSVDVLQKQEMTISIEIQNHINGLAKTFNNMKQDMLDEVEDKKDKEKLGKELGKVDNALNEVQQIKTKEEAKSSTAMDRISRFITKLGDTSTRAGKAIKAVEDSVGYAQDLAKNYNKIAQWCGLPVVPELFLKKD